VPAPATPEPRSGIATRVLISQDHRCVEPDIRLDDRMHEASIMAELLQVVEQQAHQHGMRKVSRLKLRVGEFRMVVPELLRAAFEAMNPGTLAEGAELAMEIVPLVAFCDDCRKDIHIEDNVFYCPHCAGPLLDIRSGKELDLVELEGEGGDEP
jgi:hydrogenase nickel incorporation protein HypA/HybF